MDRLERNEAESADTILSLSSLSPDKVKGLLSSLDDIQTVQGRKNLVRFNLSGTGVRKLALDGQRHLTHHMDAESSIKGILFSYVIQGVRQRSTVFWPGELASHAQMWARLKNVIPDVALEDKYSWRPDAKDTESREIFSDSFLRNISDWLLSAAQ